MYQFFVEDEQVTEDGVLITGSDVNHIRNVLRMKPGERVRISTRTGSNYLCSITQVEEMSIAAQILETMAGTELPNRIVLFQGLPKADKMELIIQKAVELGAAEIVPVSMKNCVVKLDAKKAENKVKRWQQIAESAAKQSKRSLIPAVHEVLSYREAVAYAAECDVCLVPYENEQGMAGTKTMIEAIVPGESIAVFIGPEGGFDESEIAEARDAGMKTISLGNRILRTETAGLAALSILMYQIESKE